MALKSIKVRFEKYLYNKDWYALEILPRVCYYRTGDNVSNEYCLDVGWLFWSVRVWWWKNR
jgi:hypothetical protein